MKRIFLVILAFAFYIIANAQKIPKSIFANAKIIDKAWNLELGCDRQQVTNVIKAHNLKRHKYQPLGDEITYYSDTSFDFGGEEWNYAKFSFYRDKLYSFSFRYSSSFSLKESFERLKNTLDNKYSRLISEKNLHSDRRWYVVYGLRGTTLKLSYHFSQNENSVHIEFYDESLIREDEAHTR